MPLTAGTAAVGLFTINGGLGLPLPFLPVKAPFPLVIYGASGSVGTYAVQLAKRSSLHPLICIAGGSAGSLEALLDRDQGDTIIDYRKGDAQVTEEIKKALNGIPLRYALDTVAHGKSSANIAQAMSHGGRIARTLPAEGEGMPNDVEQFQLSVSSVHGGEKDFGFVMFKLFGRGLLEGWLTPRPYKIVPGGLSGVEQALSDLKAGKARANKFALRIAET